MPCGNGSKRWAKPIKPYRPILKPALVTFMTMLSLLLSLATTVLCVRSYWIYDRISVSGGFNQTASNRGVLKLDINRRMPLQRPISWNKSRSQDGWDQDGGRFGFLYYRGTGSQTGRRLFEIPHWFVILLFSILPTWRYLHRRPVPPPAGMCIKCGYDLRATPDRCPECGTISERGHHSVSIDGGLTFSSGTASNPI